MLGQYKTDTVTHRMKHRSTLRHTNMTHPHKRTSLRPLWVRTQFIQHVLSWTNQLSQHVCLLTPPSCPATAPQKNNNNMQCH